MNKEIGDYILSLQAVVDIITAKLYSSFAPEDIDRPYVVIQEITANSRRSHAGLSGDGVSIWQVDCYADSAAVAYALKEAIRKGIDGFTGYMGAIRISNVIMDGSRKSSSPESKGSEKHVHRQSMDFRFIHSEDTEDRTYTTTTTTTTT
jgi:hypothetical protein